MGKCLTHHPGTDLNDQPGFFSQRDEFSGRNAPLLRMLPADEGLHAVDEGGRQGLVVVALGVVVLAAAKPAPEAFEALMPEVDLERYVSERRDTPYWRDNAANDRLSDSLRGVLDAWFRGHLRRLRQDPGDDLLVPGASGRLRAWPVAPAVGNVRNDGPQTHLVKKGTPTMGGLLILIAIGTTVLLWGDLSNRYTWVVLLVTLGFGVVGFVDDWKDAAAAARP